MFPLCPSQSSAMADPESTTNDFIYVEDILDEDARELQLDAIDAVDLGLAQDPTFASWADAMEVDHQLATIPMPEMPQMEVLPEVPQKEIVPELPHVEVVKEQALHPLPPYNIPYCYTLEGFQRLPFRHQKEFSFRCRKTLETDAFGEAQPLSEEIKVSLRMQIDEFDREKRRRASKACEVPLPKPKPTRPMRSHSHHASSQSLQVPKISLPPPTAISRLREPLVSASPQLPIKALPPSIPSPVANGNSLREDLDVKVIKDMLRERANSYTTQAIAANARKVALQKQSDSLYERARKAEIARAALDQPESIIIEMVEERVAALREEAEDLVKESKVADAEARQCFAQATATQGTANRYQESTATPRQADRRPHPYQREKAHGSKASRGWNRRR
jgi:hypothetical protein